MDTIFWAFLILLVLLIFYSMKGDCVEGFNYMQSPPICYYADENLKKQFIDSYRCNIPDKDKSRVFKDFCYGDTGYFTEWATKQGYNCPENYFG